MQNWTVIEIPNTYIAAGPLVLHNDKRYWEDPWLSIQKDLRIQQLHEAYFPFAGGAHTCLGKFFASCYLKTLSTNS